MVTFDHQYWHHQEDIAIGGNFIVGGNCRAVGQRELFAFNNYTQLHWNLKIQNDQTLTNKCREQAGASSAKLSSS